MILIGEGKVHADNLPDARYYDTNRVAIMKSLFYDTSFGIRFAPIILETIKKSHKTLSYILRNQFKMSNEVYRDIIEMSADSVLKRTESQFCFAIYTRMQQCEHLKGYYDEVTRALIIPVFERFGYYSPTMCFVVFIGLMCFMGETYSNQVYGLVWKHLIRDGYPADTIIQTSYQVDDLEKRMIADEIHAWNSAKRSHH